MTEPRTDSFEEWWETQECLTPLSFFIGKSLKKDVVDHNERVSKYAWYASREQAEKNKSIAEIKMDQLQPIISRLTGWANFKYFVFSAEKQIKLLLQDIDKVEKKLEEAENRRDFLQAEVNKLVSKQLGV